MLDAFIVVAVTQPLISCRLWPIGFCRRSLHRSNQWNGRKAIFRSHIEHCMDVMNRSRFYKLSFLALSLTSLVSGCAHVRDVEPMATTIPVAQATDESLVGNDVAITTSHASIAPTVHAVSYTGDGEDVVVQPHEMLDDGAIETPTALTLAEIEQIALTRNPAISAAHAASSKAAGLFKQVGVRPNPTVGYFGSQIADQGTDQHGVFVEQEFVRGNKLRLNREVLRHTAAAQRWEAEVQRHRVLTDVRVRFYEASAAQRQLTATDEFVEVASRGVKIAADRLEAEEGSKVDLLQAKTLLSEINLVRQQTYASYRGAWQELAAIAGMPDSQPIQLTDTFAASSNTRDWASTYAELLSQSPEIARANELICEKLAYLNRQKVQATPNITAQFGAGYDNATDSGLINLQIGAPIPVFNKNCGNISAAYADYTRAVANLDRIELAIRSRLARVAQEYESSMAAVQRYQQEILPQTKESLTLSESAYVAGELEFLQVLVIRQRYFDSMIAYIQSQGQLAQANAKIDGLLLTGGLDVPEDFTSGDGLRGQSFGGQ